MMFSPRNPGYAALTSLLNEFKLSLEPSLGRGTMSDPEQGQVTWTSWFAHHQVVFHPRDHQAKLSEMNYLVNHEAEQAMNT